MKAVIILSGGLDSTTLLYYMLRREHSIKAMSFNYGQRHVKELDYAKKVCKKLGVEHEVVDIRNIGKLISNSSLMGKGKIPEGHYQAESMKSTVVPNRNMIMLSIAIGWAENMKYEAVAIANHSGDHAIYPDCTPKFIELLDMAANVGTYQGINIYAPFTDINKNDVAMLGLGMGIDYDKDSWTCYKGLEVACGKCGSCTERKEALDYAKNKLSKTNS